MFLERDDQLFEAYTVRANGQCPEVAYRRKIQRTTNEEGKFNRLLRELQKMADEFKHSMDEVMIRYEGCNGDKKLLRKHLEGNYNAWTEQESEVLRNTATMLVDMPNSSPWG